MNTELSTLDNGLRIVTVAMPGLETVAVGLHAESGSRHESALENGVAHMVEHMVFKGTKTRSARGIAEAVEDVGGALNAYTSRDGTAFHARLLSGDLPLGIELIADLVRNPRFDAEELEREKAVVLSELGEARDTPDDIVFDNLQVAAFPGQALGRSILGDEASIAALSTDALQGWLASQYQPGSLILSVAGKVDHAAVVAQAERLFGDLAPGRRPAATTAAFGGEIHLDTRRFEQAHMTLGFEGLATRDPDELPLRLFSEALGGGMSSRLFQELREERGLAYSIYSSVTHYEDTGLFTIYLATARKDAARALELVDRLMADCAENLDPREVDRARAQSKAGLLMALESAQGQADFWARGLAIYGKLMPPSAFADELDAITVDQVREAGRRMLSGPRAIARVGAPKLRAA